MRDRLISLVLALVALAIFVAMFFQGEAKIASSMPHTEDRGEQGLAGFYGWLKARGVNVQSHRRRWHELPQSEGQVLLTHAPYRELDTDTRTWRDAPRVYQEDREQKGLVRWVAMGNTLVIALAAADPDAPEYYQREQERSELGYFRLLHAFGWDTNSASNDAASEAWQNTDAAAKSVEDDEPGRDAYSKSNKQGPQAPHSKTRSTSDSANPFKLSADAPFEALPSAVTPEPIASDPLKARPAALHRLLLELPGQKQAGLAPIALEHLTWSSQESQISGMYRYEGENFGRECTPPFKDIDDEERDEAADEDYSEEDEDQPVFSLQAPARAVERAVLESSEPLDFSEDQILADGSTLASNGARLYPLCNPIGLVNALPLMTSQRDGTAQGWWAPFGKGRLVVLPYGGLFRNRSLHQADNARAGEALLQRFQAPNARIFFDDYRYGLSDIYDPEAFYRDPRLYGSVAIAVLLWLMYAVGRRSRLLPVRLARPRFSSAQMAVNLSEFYARKLDAKELAALLLGHFERALAQRYGAEVSTSGAVLERVQAKLTALGTAPATLEKLSLLAKGDSNSALTELLDELARTLRLEGVKATLSLAPEADVTAKK